MYHAGARECLSRPVTFVPLAGWPQFVVRPAVIAETAGAYTARLLRPEGAVPRRRCTTGDPHSNKTVLLWPVVCFVECDSLPVPFGKKIR